jgi:hypothetical protein
MSKPERFTPEQVITAIQATHGMLALAAERLQCSPVTVYTYAKRYPEVQQAINESRERLIDIAELRLIKAVQKGEPWAIRFYLCCQARSRGYAQKFDVRMEIQRIAARVAEKVRMTADEVIAEAEAYLREEFRR